MTHRTVPARWAAVPLLGLCTWAGAQQAGNNPPRGAVSHIRTDASTHAGPALALPGPNYLIPEPLGRRVGANLFHSFSEFSLDRGESATFTTQTPGLANVISRVTGGAPSVILGSLNLQAAGGTPAFFFINPAGVVFGEGARVDVPGAFHVSTAAQLRLGDGSRWSTGQADSSFSAAPPEAFGFLGTVRAAPVLLQAQTVLNHPGRVQLVAGDLRLQGSVLVGAGGVSLHAVGAQAVDVPLDGAVPAGGDGLLRLSQGALVGTGARGAVPGGVLQVRAGLAELSEASALISTQAAGASAAGGDLDVQVAGSLTLDSGSFLQALSTGTAPGGAVRVQAQSLDLSGGAYLETGARDRGDAGAIDLRLSGALRLSDGASLYSSSQGSGRGGDILVQAARLQIDSGGYVQSLAQGSGAGGQLRLQATDLVLDQGEVSSAAQGSGASGALSLLATRLQIGHQSRVSNSALADAPVADTLLRGSEWLRVEAGSDVRVFGLGRGGIGSLQLQGGQIELLGSGVSSTAFGSGHTSGRLLVQADGLLRVDGGSQLITSGLQGAAAGELSLRAQDLRVAGQSLLVTSSLDGNGDAGDLRLQASRTLVVTEGASLSADTHSDADAGVIQLQARDIELSGGARLGSTAFRGRGNAAGVELLASGTLRMDGATVISGTLTPGRGGNLTLRGQDVVIAGNSNLLATANAPDGGAAGLIDIQAGASLRVEGGSNLDSSSFTAHSPAGGVRLRAGGALTLDRARLSSFSGVGDGPAGRIELIAQGTLQILNDSFIATSTLAGGAAGQVQVQGQSLRIAGSRLSSTALEGSQGNAGTIDLQATQDMVLLGSTVTTGTSGAGAAGAVHLRATDILLAQDSLVDAQAFAGSGGQTGDVSLIATERIRLQSGSRVQITNGATVRDPSHLQATQVLLQAPRIELDNATVSAGATGNANASQVRLEAGQVLQLVDSLATTNANDGNGGALTASAGERISLQRSGLITSVLGQQGNGGDIDVRTDLLTLDAGFIQANTAARGARGGNVRIDARGLVASGNRLMVGGAQPLRFIRGERAVNVIQAAAPDGVGGNVAVASRIDLAGTLALLDRRLLDTGGLGRSPCAEREGSRLALSGRGGLPRRSTDLGGRVDDAPPPTAAVAQALRAEACR